MRTATNGSLQQKFLRPLDLNLLAAIIWAVLMSRKLDKNCSKRANPGAKRKDALCYPALHEQIRNWNKNSINADSDRRANPGAKRKDALRYQGAGSIDAVLVIRKES